MQEAKGSSKHKKNQTKAHHQAGSFHLKSNHTEQTSRLVCLLWAAVDSLSVAEGVFQGQHPSLQETAPCIYVLSTRRWGSWTCPACRALQVRSLEWRSTPRTLQRWKSSFLDFFCSRNCCLCAVHQSVKELRRARSKGNQETKPKTKQAFWKSRGSTHSSLDCNA